MQHYAALFIPMQYSKLIFYLSLLNAYEWICCRVAPDYAADLSVPILDRG